MQIKFDSSYEEGVQEKFYGLECKLVPKQEREAGGNEFYLSYTSLHKFDLFKSVDKTQQRFTVENRTRYPINFRVYSDTRDNREWPGGGKSYRVAPSDLG